MSAPAAGFPTSDISEPPLCPTAPSSGTAALRHFGTASQKARQAAERSWAMNIAAMVIALLAAVNFVQAPAGKRADLDGVWILLRAENGNLQLTPAGEKLRAAYDFQKDDPDFRCIPASFTRVMHTPSPPIEV